MKKKDEGSSEIVSFNEELVSFDINDLEVEELERRFELAIGGVYEEGSCGVLTCQSVVCDDLQCGTFTVAP